ncbi:glycosyltransferase [Kitasatospora sp. NPDC056181]|uniref:glycosyltransferase n=1 Tax=Kitasatospora sp. NPDC056181 TaxID=3345737 RepID=UPI0035D77076
MPNIDTALTFFPRGGSAQVARYLLREYNRRNWTTRIHAGSLGQPGDPGHAPTFYAGLDLRTYDYNPAYARFTAGQDPQSDPLPFHPSYEDRSLGARGCPDPMFAAVPPTAGARLTRAWTSHLTRHRSTRPDALHLHHLSYLQTAAYRAYGGVPRITTLHGTELKQIQGMRERINLARHLGTTTPLLANALHPDRPHRERTLKQLAHDGRLNDDQELLLRTTEWPKWRFSDYWHAALTASVQQAGHVVTVSHHDRDLALRLLPALRGQEVPVITNGVDITAFRPAELTEAQRLSAPVSFGPTRTVSPGPTFRPFG